MFAVNKNIEELSYRINPQGNFPFFLSENINIKLSVENHRIGMDVFNRFKADFKGTFSFNNPDTSSQVILDFKFPLGTAEAKNVSLKFVTDGISFEPPDVIYDREGIFWAGHIEGDKVITAEISFVAQGRDIFEYYLPPGSRTREVNLTLEMKKEPEYFIPDWALQPTSIDSGLISWKFKNLVTDRAVIIDFLEAKSPTGRVVLMCKLVGIAVLFFGIGFWYLAALYKTEGLSSFRWAHFFLLALTYSLFFVIFGVLGFRGDISTWIAILIAGVLSLPLLTIHVSRIIDMKFALSRNLPFSIFTLLLVINGVYGGGVRDYIFIAAAFIAVAFVTITFRTWSLNREKWIDKLNEDVKKEAKTMEHMVKEGKDLYKKSEEILKKFIGEEHKELTDELKELRKKILHGFKEYEQILNDLSRLEYVRKNHENSEFYRNSIKNKLSLMEYSFINDKNSLKIAINSILSISTEKKENKDIKETGAEGKNTLLFLRICKQGNPILPFLRDFKSKNNCL